MLFEKMRGKRATALFAGTAAALTATTILVAPMLSTGPASASWFQLQAPGKGRTMKTNPPPPAPTTSTTMPPSTTTTTSTTPPSTTTTTSTTPPSTTTTTTTTTPTNGTASDQNCQNTAPLGLAGSWTCTFDDEFNGTSLDTTKWQPMLTATSGFVAGPDCYVDNPQTISESGGYLNLSVVRVPQFACAGSYDSSYEAGTVTTRGLFSQTYGAFEVNAKLPQSDVPGLQETFWLYPDNLTYGAWPASGEIDFAEFYSIYENYDVPYVHYNYTGSDPNSTTYSCEIDPTQFNTYELDWTPTTLTMLYNGHVCLTDSWLNGPAPFNEPFFMILTQAIGLSGGNEVTDSTQSPATTQIDWVRAWQAAS